MIIFGPNNLGEQDNLQDINYIIIVNREWVNDDIRAIFIGSRKVINKKDKEDEEIQNCCH